MYNYPRIYIYDVKFVMLYRHGRRRDDDRYATKRLLRTIEGSSNKKKGRGREGSLGNIERYGIISEDVSKFDVLWRMIEMYEGMR